MNFLTTPTISSTGTPYTLSSEIISADTANVFTYLLIGGILCGLTFAILRRVTGTLWR